MASKRALGGRFDHSFLLNDWRLGPLSHADYMPKAISVILERGKSIESIARRAMKSVQSFFEKLFEKARIFQNFPIE